MLELTVAASGSHMGPTVFLKQFDEITYFHQGTSVTKPPNARHQRRACGRDFLALYRSRVRCMAWLAGSSPGRVN